MPDTPNATGGPQPGQIYRQFQDGLYVIICRSIQEDTFEPLVTYRSNRNGLIWTRTLKSFTEMVLTITGTGDHVPRFQREPT